MWRLEQTCPGVLLGKAWFTALCWICKIQGDVDVCINNTCVVLGLCCSAITRQTKLFMLDLELINLKHKQHTISKNTYWSTERWKPSGTLNLFTYCHSFEKEKNCSCLLWKNTGYCISIMSNQETITAYYMLFHWRIILVLINMLCLQDILLPNTPAIVTEVWLLQCVVIFLRRCRSVYAVVWITDLM